MCDVARLRRLLASGTVVIDPTTLAVDQRAVRDDANDPVEAHPRSRAAASSDRAFSHGEDPNRNSMVVEQVSLEMQWHGGPTRLHGLHDMDFSFCGDVMMATRSFALYVSSSINGALMTWIVTTLIA